MKPCRHPCCPDAGPCKKVKPPAPRKPIQRKPIPKKVRTPLKRSKKRINPISAKQKLRLRYYSTLRKQFLSANPICRPKFDGCSFHSTDVHHGAGRIGNNLLDTSTWIEVCRSCHQWIETHPKEAKDLGFSKSRLIT